MARWRRKILAIAVAGLLFIGFTGFTLQQLDHAYPPPLEQAQMVSSEVLASDGQLLRAFAMPGGQWRLKTTIHDVDPQFLKMLIAYEDQRFWTHHGIDVLALGRAAGQLLIHGRIVSGASTLSMQVARLIEPRKGRSWTAKLRQIARAIQIEKRLSKAQILNLYLTHAPYGGNLEGVRAASLAYFGKEPKRLTIAQASLLVALPQLPEKRRPDRNPAKADQARRQVLARDAVAALVGEGEAQRAALVSVPASRMQLPALAAHVAEAAIRKDPKNLKHQTTLNRQVQQNLEAVARETAARLGSKLSIAMIMADAQSGEIVAEVGSADYFDASRSGWVDMTDVLRSPGSTLKPFIYGLAFEEGLVAQETIIEDRPADFFGYRPRNFDMSYQGDVSIRQALQLSLNVPAVRLLDSLGPLKLLARLRHLGVRPVLPPNEAPGLAIALGGVGISLRGMVQLYASLANGGNPIRLGNGIKNNPEIIEGRKIFGPVALWNVTDILSNIRPPVGAAKRAIAYKTGTSYGYRDAWSIGYDGRYVLGVWIGRPDNAAIPGISGYKTAAPVLFDAFVRSGVAAVPFAQRPSGAVNLSQSQLPVSQKRFSVTETGLINNSARERAPLIVYPPEGARIDLRLIDEGKLAPVTLKLQGGKAPFRWIANGKPLPDLSRRRTEQWQPDGVGYSTLAVIDATGRAASVGFFID